MWKEILPALHNVLSAAFLVGFGMLVYNVLILRGRAFEKNKYEGSSWAFRSLLSQPEPAAYQLPRFTGTYTIRLLADGRYEQRFKNRSLMPYLVTMFEYKNWKYQLLTPELFRCAHRYSVTNHTNLREIDSGIGFSCGSGLGYSLIRPFEVFTDTISSKVLFRQMSVRDFINVNEKDMLIDKFTQQVYGPATGFERRDESKLLELFPNDSLSIRFYLPVKTWTNLTPGRFLSNSIKVRRHELLYSDD